MRKYSAFYKGKARVALHGAYSIPIVALIILVVFYLVCSAPFNNSLLLNQNSTSFLLYAVANILISLILYAIFVGYIYMMMKLGRGERVYIRDLFFSFRNRPDRFLPVFLIREGILFLCLLPSYITLFMPIETSNLLGMSLISAVLTIVCLIVGLLLTARFVFAEYFLIQDINMKGIDGIKESNRLMKGRVGQLIYIYFSFAGYFVLSIISFNVGFLWTIPYLIESLVQMYFDLTGEAVIEANAPGY